METRHRVSPRAYNKIQVSGFSGSSRRHRRLPASLLVLILTAGALLPAQAEFRNFAGELGAIVQKSPGGRVTGTLFRTWAPNAESVAVIGSFNSWNPRRHEMKKERASGVWSLEIRGAKPGDEYMFLINGHGWSRPPRAKA